MQTQSDGMDSELQSRTAWESKGSRVPGTFEEESEVREFSPAYFEMSCIKMCSAGRQILTESSDIWEPEKKKKQQRLTSVEAQEHLDGGKTLLQQVLEQTNRQEQDSEGPCLTLWLLFSRTKCKILRKQSDKTFSTDGQNKGPQTDAWTWATKTTGQVKVTTARYFCFMKDPVKGWGKTPRGRILENHRAGRVQCPECKLTQ